MDNDQILKELSKKFKQLHIERFSGATTITIGWREGGIRNCDVEINKREKIVVTRKRIPN